MHECALLAKRWERLRERPTLHAHRDDQLVAVLAEVEEIASDADAQREEVQRACRRRDVLADELLLEHRAMDALPAVDDARRVRPHDAVALAAPVPDVVRPRRVPRRRDGDRRRRVDLRAHVVDAVARAEADTHHARASRK